MAAWNKGKIGDVCHVVPGYAFKSSDWQDEGIPVVKIKNITGDNSVDLTTTDCVPRSLLTPRLQKFVITDGDILVAMTGATAGKVGRVRTNHPLLLNQRVAKIAPVNADSKFIWAVVSSQEYQEKFFYLADGAAQPNMSGGQIEGVEIPLPPLPTQRRIAGILSAYDELIENSQRRIKILESMARALYREWFVHFRFPGHESVLLVPSDLGEIPKGWEVRTIRQIAGVVSRGPSLTYVDSGGVQVVNQRCIRNEEIEMQAVQYAAPLPENKSHLYLQPRDVLINSMGVGTLGRVSRNLSVDEPTIIHNCITVVRSKAGEPTTALLYYRLSSCQEHFESLGIGATGQTSLRIETIEDVLLAFPPVVLLTTFEAAVLPMWTQVGILKRQIQNLRRTRDLLLPRLLSGQIDVEAIPA